MSSQRDDDAIALVGLLLAINSKKRTKRKRKTWCNNWFLKRDTFAHTTLQKELNSHPMNYPNSPMSEEVYQKLLTMVAPLIQKKNTVMRAAISPHERLSATLRFLTTGQSYECLKLCTKISPQALGKIIPETCEAIYKVLQEEYLKFPDSSEKWESIAKTFEEKWHFPHCIGAMDGRHIDIIPPANSRSLYFNYKGKHSLVLLAIVDARHRFISADLANGRISDVDVQNTTLNEKLNSNNFNIPRPSNVSEEFREVPYVYVSDGAFPLTMNIMKPYRQTELDSTAKENYNYRFSRVRHVVKNAFGILASRFRIYHTQMNLEPRNISKIVMATCVLHNFLMEQQPTYYVPPNSTYQENDDGEIVCTGLNTTESSMIPLDCENQRDVDSTTKLLRDKFSAYFVNEGKIQ